MARWREGKEIEMIQLIVRIGPMKIGTDRNKFREAIRNDYNQRINERFAEICVFGNSIAGNMLLRTVRTKTVAEGLWSIFPTTFILEKILSDQDS